MSSSSIPDLPDSGSLETATVPRLLAQAWRDQRTGRLELVQGPRTRSIAVRSGYPTGVDAGQTEDTFARFLEYKEQISAADRTEVERLATELGTTQAKAVLARKLLEPVGLYQALRAEARLRIAETFEWQKGSYEWYAETSEDENKSAKPYDVLALIQTELPRRLGSDRLFSAITAIQDFCGEISPRERKVAATLALAGDPAKRAIARLDGRTPLGRILGECAGEPLAASTLWTLLHAGVVRPTKGRSLSDETADQLDFDIEVEVAAVATEEIPDAAALNPAAQRGRGDSKSDAMREEIERLHTDLRDLSFYAILGLEEDANATQIKKAYFKAAKRFHPDAIARLGLKDIKERGAEVFARIAEAFETLSDPDKRRAYDAGGSDEPAIDTARLAQAEKSFRKGEILAKMGNFEGALEYLEPAVELWPDEPAYQAGLGWAHYRKPKTDLERARQHLEIAHSQAPDDARIMQQLGHVLRDSGEADVARALLDRALSLDPSLED